MWHMYQWGFLGMHFFWWVFWFAAITIFLSLLTPVPKNQLKSGERALDILRRRYAAGQVSTEEYEKRKAVLERDEPGAVDTSTRPAAHAHH